MRIIAVDDEQAALDILTQAIFETEPEAEVHAFRTPREALEDAAEFKPEVAFLDIQMAGMSGLQLAKSLKRQNANVNVIFVTGYSEFALDAMGLHASGYLLKPVCVEDVRQELADLRNPSQDSIEKGLYFHTFGNFEAFADGKPLRFRYEKTREMLAYLFDRQGALCSNNEIIAVLWEDDDHASYYRQLRKDLADTLRDAGYEDAVERHRGRLGLVMKGIRSDYLDWQNGEPSAINAYHGEYMAQYSWAETTNALFL